MGSSPDESTRGIRWGRLAIVALLAASVPGIVSFFVVRSILPKPLAEPTPSPLTFENPLVEKKPSGEGN